MVALCYCWRCSILTLCTCSLVCMEQADQRCAGQAHFRNFWAAIGGDGGFFQKHLVSHIVPVELHVWLPQATNFPLCVFEHLHIVEHLSSYSELNYYVTKSLSLFFPTISASILHLLTFCLVTVRAILAFRWWRIYGSLEVARVLWKIWCIFLSLKDNNRKLMIKRCIMRSSKLITTFLQ